MKYGMKYYLSLFRFMASWEVIFQTAILILVLYLGVSEILSIECVYEDDLTQQRVKSYYALSEKSLKDKC